MLKNNWMKGLAGLGLLVGAGIAQAQAPAPPAAPRPNPPQANPAAALERKPGDLPGPIDSIQDVQDSLKMAFMMADQDHDGLISQREATDAGNMLVGGLFFAADANGDGALTKDEAVQAREKVLQNNPLLRFIAQRAKDSAQKREGGETNVGRNLGNLIDTDEDKKLEASEVRQAVQSTVQGVFAVADTNRDEQLSPTEMNAAVYGLAQAALKAAFQAADADKNGSLSKDEFSKAIVEPSKVVFDILDADLDGQLTDQELERAGRVVVGQLQVFRIPQAENSPERLIQQGRRPEEVAPVPNVRIPATDRAPARPPARPTQPPTAEPRRP